MPTKEYANEYNLKAFLDETALNLSSYSKIECLELFDQLVNLILKQDPETDVCEEVLSFCAASVLEMSKSSSWSLKKLLQSSKILKKYSNFHVFVDAVTSTLVSLDRIEIDEDILIESVISGLSAIESQTISLSGSSLIKLLKNNPKGVSRSLKLHPDFVAILTADMCAMFSRLEEESIQLAPFIRIVRFCELIIELGGDVELEGKIIETVKNEFINKIYRTKLRQMRTERSEALKWCNELMKVCHRGNQLVRILVNEVFKNLNVSIVKNNSDLKEILRNERSRTIEEIVNILFIQNDSTSTSTSNQNKNKQLKIPECKNIQNITDSIYGTNLKRLLNSFESFPIALNFKSKNSLTDFAHETFTQNREILLNWLPFCLQVTEVEGFDVEMQMFIDISGRINEFL